MCLRVYYSWENKRRDRRYGRVEDMAASQQSADDLSQKTDREIKSFRYLL
jgi:hypothetical protein